jgi:hypothetical protein
MIEATEKFSTDFMETRDQGGQQEREACFECLEPKPGFSH